MSSESKLYLQIAGISLLLDSDRDLKAADEFIPFCIPPCVPDWVIRFRQTDRLPHIPEAILHQDQSRRVHTDNRSGYLQSWFDAPRDMTPYGVVTCDQGAQTIRIDYLGKGSHCVSDMHNSFAHLNIEKLLIHHDRLCFHAACVQTPLGGILFSGPSGIGKSTQAELWCQHRSAKQINGDRPILSRAETGWLAWGSPYAGSSRCHINESCPVSAIVMLRQSPQCSLRRLDSAEAFRAVWSGLTMHSWDESFVEKACDLALVLIDDVAVFEFSCTPDEEAVKYLERELRKEGCL